MYFFRQLLHVLVRIARLQIYVMLQSFITFKITTIYFGKEMHTAWVFASIVNFKLGKTYHCWDRSTREIIRIKRSHH